MMIGTNPFVIDTPVGPDDLIDREAELGSLAEWAEGGHNCRLSAPRRYGKTSVLLKLQDEAERLGMATAYVDFFGILSLEEALGRIESAYEQSLKGALGRWYAGVRRSLRPSARIGDAGASVELALIPDSDVARAFQSALELPERIFDREGRRTLVVFDEFQDVLAAGKLDALIRARIQRQRRCASYVFAGSHPGLMAELFGSKERPLYGQSRPLVLAPLPDEALAAYVSNRFDQTGREIGRALEPLLELARGHPQRAMLGAHHIWELTKKGAAADEGVADRAFSAMLGELQEVFERTWEDLSTNEKRVMAAVAWTGRWGQGTSLYSRSTLERFRLAKGTARDVRATLLKQGEIERSGRNQVRIVDPVLEAWIASGRRSRVVQ